MNIYKLTVVLAVIVVLPNANVGASKQNSLCASSCKCSGSLKRRLAYYKQKNSNAIDRRNDLQKGLLRLLLSTQQETMSVTKTIAPTIAAIGSALHSCEQAIKDADKRDAEATAAVAAARSRLAIAHRLAAQTTDLKAQIQETSYWNTQSIATHTIGDFNLKGCDATEETEDGITIDGDTEKGEKATPKAITHKVLKGRCVATSGDASCHGTAMTAEQGYLEFKLGYAADGAADTDPWGAATDTEKKLKAAAVDIYDKELDYADGNLTRLRDATDLSACATNIRELTEVSQLGNFKRLAIKALLNQPGNEKDDTVPTEALEKALTSAFGKDGANFAKVVYDTPGNKQTEISDADKKKTNQLKNINTLSELTDALARATLKRLTATHDATANPTAIAVTDKDCSGKKGEACTGECILDGETCRPKNKGEGVKKENEGTTNTNTTGSNSFVINKTPLLLAFFFYN
uniref:Variant surface glycoprotein 1125.4757 n=1 Tax=Trypanosoma brucei TaxID=5691 RepID=A0A1J0RAR6_9TRYP|nr:variant surface glycoprotein 1125.4757 [Trypanosoma brucei]